MFYPYVLRIWFNKNTTAISLSNHDVDSDVEVLRTISNNREYLTWLQAYEENLTALYENNAWFVSKSHTNKDKYLKEFTQEVEYLKSKLDKIHA